MHSLKETHPTSLNQQADFSQPFYFMEVAGPRTGILLIPCVAMVAPRLTGHNLDACHWATCPHPPWIRAHSHLLHPLLIGKGLPWPRSRPGECWGDGWPNLRHWSPQSLAQLSQGDSCGVDTSWRRDLHRGHIFFSEVCFILSVPLLPCNLHSMAVMAHELGPITVLAKRCERQLTGCTSSLVTTFAPTESWKAASCTGTWIGPIHHPILVNPTSNAKGSTGLYACLPFLPQQGTRVPTSIRLLPPIRQDPQVSQVRFRQDGHHCALKLGGNRVGKAWGHCLLPFQTTHWWLEPKWPGRGIHHFKPFP